MATKLGELLVARKVLSAEDLKKALDTQLMFGGRLGTNLLDLGFISEKELDEALYQQVQVEVATEALLKSVQPAVLRLVPPKVAEKHCVIPLALESRKLKVAMLDPTDLIVLDELAFVTGHQIQALICPEVRLRNYLEKHYGISRPLRYVALSRTRPGQVSGDPRLDDESLAASYSTNLQEFDGGSGKAVPLAGGGEIEEPHVVEPHEMEPPTEVEAITPRGEPVMALGEALGVEGEVTPEDVARADELPPEKRAQVDQALQDLKKQRAEQQAAAAAQRGARVARLEDLARLLAEADTREDIGEALLAFASNHFQRVMTYVIQRDRALGWLAHVPGVDPIAARRAARRVQVGLDVPSVLQGVVESGQYYMGEVPSRAGDETYVAGLGAPRPGGVVLLPIQLSDKVIIVLHGDDLDKPIKGFDMRAMRAACHKAEQAMDVLLLRSKIRQVD
ncbi:MAG: hypothetical protein AAF533_27185 [Acidobacteriota bacterium]